MKKGIKALFVLLFLILYTFGALAAEKANKPQIIKTVENYIAVFDFEVTTGDKGISRPLADKVIHEFSMSDKYEVIDRGNMNKILKEQKFQMTGCVAQECKVEAGQILGVGKIVNGSVGIVGKTYYLTLQLIDVKTGKVELSAEDECRCEIDELLGSTKRLAKKLLGEKYGQLGELAARTKAEEERIKAEMAARAKLEEERIRTEKAARTEAEDKQHVLKTVIAEVAPPAVSSTIIASDVRFEKFASGVVRDKKNSLDWYAGADKNTVWDDANGWAANLTIDGGGWRMPTSEELKILYQKGAGSRNMTPLLETTGWLIWSGETVGPGGVRVKDFSDGRDIFTGRGNSINKRGFAVRSTPKIVTAGIDSALVSAKIIASDGRFEKLASGVVRDIQNGLDWYAGPDKNIVWDDAKNWAANLRIDDGGWRMPTIAELKSLYLKGAGPRNMTPLLETAGWLVWTGETAGAGGVRVIDFGDGREMLTYRSDSINKRGFAVRSRK